METPSYFEQPTVNASQYTHWPQRFQQLLNVGLEYIDEDPNALTEENVNSQKESIIWSHKPGKWAMYKRFIYVGIIMEIIFIAMSLAVALPWMIILGTLILIFSILFAMNITYSMNQAYILTNKSILIFRSGFPKVQVNPPDTILKNGYSHCIKIPFHRAFPMITSLQLKSGSGELWFASQQLQNVKIFIPDLRTVQRMIFEGYQLSNRPKVISQQPRTEADDRFQIE